MEYLLMMGVGIIIGMLVVISFNVKKTKEEEENPGDSEGQNLTGRKRNWKVCCL